MKRLLLFLLVLTGVANCAIAQSLQLLNATEQSWSGGVCCRMGTNYSITLESPDTVHLPVIDTIWINDTWHAANGVENFSVQKSKAKGKTTYQLFVGESHDTNNTPDILKMKTDKPKIHPPAYKGKACIIYTLNGRKKLLDIKSFTKLRSLQYP